MRGKEARRHIYVTFVFVTSVRRSLPLQIVRSSTRVDCRTARLGRLPAALFYSSSKLFDIEALFTFNEEEKSKV